MKKLIGIGACLMLAASLSTGCSSNSSQTEVTTAIAKSGRDLSSMVWQGTVEALSTIDIMPEASGKVTEVNASEGQHVEKGVVIFRWMTPMPPFPCSRPRPDMTLPRQHLTLQKKQANRIQTWLPLK